MTFKFILKTAVTTVFTFTAITGTKVHAQDSSSSACEMWLCLPAYQNIASRNPFLTPAERFGVLSANCGSAYRGYALRTLDNIVFTTALPDFDGCMANGYFDRHPEMDIRSRARRSRIIGTNWERYEIEVRENGVKKGEWEFQHRHNRQVFPEDPRRPAIRRESREGDFSNLFPF